jgi:hypothetical protein
MWLRIWFSFYEWTTTSTEKDQDRKELDRLQEKYGPEKLGELERRSRNRSVDERSRRHWRRLYKLKRCLMIQGH